MKRIKILGRNLPGDTFFKVLLVFIVVAILMTIKEVAEIVSKGIAAVTNNAVVPAVEVVQNTAANMAWLGVGLLLLVLAPIFLVAIVKWSVIIIGVAIAGVALYNLYNTFFNKKTESVLPSKLTR